MGIYRVYRIYIVLVTIIGLFSIWNFFNRLPGKKLEAIDLLTIEGYNDIELTGYQFFACSEEDAYRIGFSATKNARRVKGVVCSNVAKGATVRVFSGN